MPGYRYLMVLTVLTAWGCTAGSPANAAEAADPETVRKQAAQIEELQRQLQQAQEELRRMQAAEPAPNPSNSPVAPPAHLERKTAQPAPEEELDWAALPELTRTTVVSAEDLARHFQTAPVQAKQRYRGKTFLVKGTVVGFGLPKLVRRYDLELKSPEDAVSLTCRFDYVDRYRTVYAEADGRTLVGRIGQNSIQVLSRRGEEVVIQGRCRGLKRNRLEFTDCERIRIP